MSSMEKVAGRSDDMIILPGVNVFPTQVAELVRRVPGLSPHFQLVLSRPARLDKLTVQVGETPRAQTSGPPARSDSRR